MALPETIYVRRKDIMREYGLSSYSVGCLRGVRRRILPGRKYAVYLRAEVVKTMGKEKIKC